ncbi:MAG: PIG-L family deacetylase [Verrucomicrobia bacterium]|nr:PIG-L family deacetylase [Verrucomicrobiota bacterium]
MNPDLKKLLDCPRPAAIPAIRWPAELRLFVLAPHPDDFDAIGVTLRFFRQNGNPIQLAVVSGSASGVLDEFCLPPDSATKAAIREQEQRDSLRFFGLGEECAAFLRLREDDAGAPLDDAVNETAIRRQLVAHRPQVVFLPHGEDSNAGHRRAHAMFLRAAAALDEPPAAFLIRDPKTLNFRCDLYMPFDEEKARWKRWLLLHHRSQEHRNRRQRGRGFDDRILDVNRLIAAELSCSAAFAEAFQVEVVPQPI